MRKARPLRYFYPRPPRGGRPKGGHCTAVAQLIYIHALREDGDGYSFSNTTEEIRFLSTPSARRATPAHVPSEAEDSISIHALREEGDLSKRGLASGMKDFYPRPPRGGRPGQLALRRQLQNFYPRPPRGGRHSSDDTRKNLQDFYPRPPRGGRPKNQPFCPKKLKFLSTPSARRATCTCKPLDGMPENFYPRPPRGGRPSRFSGTVRAPVISIHALREEGDPVRR